MFHTALDYELDSFCQQAEALGTPVSWHKNIGALVSDIAEHAQGDCAVIVPSYRYTQFIQRDLEQFGFKRVTDSTSVAKHGLVFKEKTHIQFIVAEPGLDRLRGTSFKYLFVGLY